MKCRVSIIIARVYKGRAAWVVAIEVVQKVLNYAQLVVGRGRVQECISILVGSSGMKIKLGHRRLQQRKVALRCRGKNCCNIHIALQRRWGGRRQPERSHCRNCDKELNSPERRWLMA